jgi:hypothetical protein
MMRRYPNENLITYSVIAVGIVIFWGAVIRWLVKAWL